MLNINDTGLGLGFFPQPCPQEPWKVHPVAAAAFKVQREAFQFIGFCQAGNGLPAVDGAALNGKIRA
ncbi:MAG: hypothetical protein ABFS30_05735 [Pseudomonadota bacterium]